MCYVWELIVDFEAHLTVAELLSCVGLYGATVALFCGLAFFVVRGRFKVDEPLRVVSDFWRQSAFVSFFVLFLLPFLPGQGHAERLSQQRYKQFQVQLCRELDCVGQDGNHPFLLFENGKGIVLLKQTGNRYLDLVRTLAKKQLPDLELQDWSPPDDASLGYNSCLVQDITDRNRVSIMNALADQGQRELFVYRVCVGFAGLIFLLQLVYHAARYRMPD